MIEVTISGKAMIPEKYKSAIEIMTNDPEVWQTMANQMIQTVREGAARGGVEVDDLIKAMEEDAKK